ncbi:DNA-protecting protein DprA, partial [Agrococcus sp. HG114]|uniref:DNA-protecting protein DprA n=1 Tax=Agrococcus sp. HG114 TaxID=2969757 RepID=UPI00215A15C0
MKPFRLDHDRLRGAVLPLVPGAAAADGPDAPDDAEVVARFAAGAWTVLPEPGDGAAGWARTLLGDVRALELLVEGADAATWARELDDPEAARSIAAALPRWRPRLDAGRILRAFAQGAAFGQRLLTRADAHWPAGLDDLGPHAPAAVWVRGDAAALERCGRSAALVGSRASSGYGELVAGQLAAGLVDRGFAVVSGGAYGIDGTAHRAALSAGGTTVAVLAG